MASLRCHFVYDNALRLQTRRTPQHILISAPRYTPHTGKMAPSVFEGVMCNEVAAYGMPAGRGAHRGQRGLLQDCASS